MNDEVLTLEEVAQLLKVSIYTIKREVDKGNLKGKKIRSMWRFRREDVDAYLRGEAPEGEAPTGTDGKQE